ncbi:MAG: cell wall hydrolase [Lachnospiraceae bacterium]|nr:cell wall hydrolase [Lachnospiraceae bacterium]
MTAYKKKSALWRRRRLERRKRQLILASACTIMAGIAAFAIVILTARAEVRKIPAEPIDTRPETPEKPIIIELSFDPVASLPVEEPEPMHSASFTLTGEEEYLLLKIAMAEAEGEDTEGKALVILTVLNRMHSGQFPDTIAEVIFAPDAFTSCSNGRYFRVDPDDDCRVAMELVQSGWDQSQGAQYFERTPKAGCSTWHSRNLEKLFIHGNHTFYKE